MTTCRLCDLPTPDPPITDEEMDGAYCCRGCLEVARTVEDIDSVDVAKEQEGDTDDKKEAEVPDRAETAYLSMEGLHCAACERFVESLATETDGVLDAEVNYTTDAAKLTYDPERIREIDLPETVSRYGYNARLPTEGGTESDVLDGRRAVVGSLFGMGVMLAYGVVLYPSYLDLPPTLDLGVLVATIVLGMLYCGVTFYLVYGGPRTAVLLAVLQAVALGTVLGTDLLSVGIVVPAVAAFATIVVFYTGFPFLRGAYVSLRSRQPNMDLLVGMAILSAYVYSIVVWLVGRAEVYFDVAVMVTLVVTLGNALQTRVKRRAVEGLTDFASARITDARRRLSDGTTERVSVDTLEPGDTVVVTAGERVPVDGRVLEGTAAVDEALLTGEAIPDTKRPGDQVAGGAIVTDDRLVVEVAEDVESTLDRLVDLLWDIQSERTGIQQFADRLAALFVPLVICVAGLTSGYYLWSGGAVATAILTGVTVLVVSCPCALGLASPLAVTKGIRRALAEEVVVTDAALFERVEGVDTTILDKTGTLTTGEMTVTDVVAAADEDEVLERAAAVEQFSSHPVATAITDHVDPQTGVSDFERHSRGVSGTVGDDRVQVGHPDLFDEADWTVPDAVREALQDDGNGSVPVAVGWNGTVHGVVTVADRPRQEWLPVVESLAEDNRAVVVLTGDEAGATATFRESDAVDEVFAGVPPEAKAQTVRRFQSEGTVAMVGDGSNDAPALATADLGIAMASSTELAAEAADAVVTSNDLTAVPRLFDLASATRSRIRQNLGWAFAYNAVAIPLAVLTLLNPLFAAVAMAGSSLVVVGNSARSLR